ncbi:NERD nuclease [Pedobacter ginsengisoli]|uniref:NERD nuclease n=1 Tax=Pedobacter ginsengisoli TaxID=363852 RepID=A0A2D1UC45_9SPHI|nr:NERD domain-containing protein [Pedobacter ginsengisoli]ATP59166.1 NERD nuclease [Pedobacter ginsengisoli]
MNNKLIEFWPLWLLLFLAIIIKIIRPLIKGIVGEITVAFFLKFLSKKDYRVMHNVTLYGNGYKSQIDHIIVSKFGVFVIETKNYKGWIMGSEHAQYWTQVIYKSKKRLYNPILQNHGHVKALKNTLSNHPNIKYIPIVVFTWKSTLKISTSSEVIKIFSLLKTIKRHKQHILTDLLKDEIFEIIKSNNRRKPKQQNQQYKVYENGHNNILNSERCPYCSGTLVIKNGRYGEFKGCSEYPRCRYTKATL